MDQKWWNIVEQINVLDIEENLKNLILPKRQSYPVLLVNSKLVAGAAVLTAPSLALRYPNNKPPLRYKILFREQPVPVMPQQPEPLKRTPSPLNHVPPSPHCATPVYTRKPPVSPEAPEHPVYPGNELATTACLQGFDCICLPLWTPSGR
ncbi:hypothetical protein POM88_026566 [Heracleum sosnowskyi]|uniref:Uncharacterized protein n=1 Tax=Heracleum sosnowskyi TaxID=360622 RepID=A0AAD8I648_9APIA|nr:hypothetical protein POM88_026566 [Heracleum sosnowskyi]